MSCEQIETSRYENYHEILAEADACKDELSVLRKKHIDRIQHLSDNSPMQISLVYPNVLQGEPGVPERDETPAQSSQEVYGEINDKKARHSRQNVGLLGRFRGLFAFLQIYCRNDRSLHFGTGIAR